MKPILLIVEDDLSMRSSLFNSLNKESYELIEAGTLEEGQTLFQDKNPDLVLLDLKLPDGDGRDFFERLRKQNIETPFIILTAFPDVKGAIDLMKKGAFEYLVKPFDLQELKIQIRKALELQGLRTEVQRLRQSGKYTANLPQIIGNSPVMEQLKNLAEKIGGTDSTVLITGDSGTGKELVAQAIHHYSNRRHSHLTTINCAAIPATLIEAELFGCEKGAFTGATTTRQGLFELAHQGTLFLDEIGEMPYELQPKLLRVLETLRVTRIGGNREKKVDVRLIAASNRDFEKLIKERKFRQDLYYRLNVVPLSVPLLRERKEDIPSLAQYYLQSIASQFGIQSHGFSEEALDTLKQWEWPGNVRELRNLMERLVILNREGEEIPTIEFHHLPVEIRGEDFSTVVPTVPLMNPTLSDPVETLEEMERKYILYAIEQCRHNKSKTARSLGVSRNTLKQKLKKYGYRDRSL